MKRRSGSAEGTALLGLTFLLLTHDLARPSLWVDELFSVQIAGAKGLGEVVAGVIAHERRPPLYHLILHGWIGLAGDSDFVLRLLSVFFGLLAVAAAIRLGRDVGGRRVGLAVGLVLSVSPAFVLYSRMVRYYSLVALLAVAATVLFLRLDNRVRRALLRERSHPHRHWPLLAAYFVTALALAYTDYGAILVSVIHTAYFASGRLQRIRETNGFPLNSLIRCSSPWLATQLVILLAYLPWLSTALSQSRGPLIAADLAGSPLGWAMKIAYPLYAFTAGETVFPWNIFGLMALAIGLMAVRRGWRDSRGHPSLLLALALFPILVSAVLTSTLAADLSFITIPSRTLYALPFFALSIALGLTRIAGPARFQSVKFSKTAVLLCLANLIALFNLYTGREYLNPIYNLPAREIATRIGNSLREGDVVIADWDSAVPYYYQGAGYSAPLIETPPVEAALSYLATHAAPRVWLVALGRDRTRNLTSPELTAWLEANYPASIQWGYGEQNPIYRAVKETLLGRASYRYRATVTLYENAATPPLPNGKFRSGDAPAAGG